MRSKPMFRYLSIYLGLSLSIAPAGALACDNLLQSDGTVGLSVKGEPAQDPQRWFTVPDYPADAERARIQGTVSIQLTIDTTGHVADCRIRESSGNASLDRATCMLVARRGRFIVQRDATGQPQPFSYAMSKTWKLTSR
ncbi:energy transducer TonB [Sphingomonas echinoides]|uniref:energy transducer TonB n=2 Tax=Sphingomonas echinoides TaxID=59803 RepID=UPI0009FE9671